ncbi:MAG: TRAP transporter substrate-binding protein [Betaproteobacteria bacterium]|nr:TRAP transporter substrate-binding protein [Betaproteobacteria bacterium]
MSNPIRITLGGYGPPNTTCSRGMKVLGDTIAGQFNNGVNVHYVWNVMDFGYKAADLLWMAEDGVLSMSYQSTSYLADRVPEMDVADLPFLFRDLDHARTAMDGAFGAWMAQKIEERIPGYRVLGFFENGYRHISNRVRTVQSLADLKAMKVRLMPGEIHRRSFELMGTTPCPLDLKPGLEAVVNGTVDAQENPFANTVDYGAHKVHRFHTLSAHCYLSRGLYFNRAQFDRWPAALQTAMRAAARKAILAQRELAIAEELHARQVIEETGGEVVELTREARAAFVRAVQPLHDDLRRRFGDGVFGLIENA